MNLIFNTGNPSIEDERFLGFREFISRWIAKSKGEEMGSFYGLDERVKCPYFVIAKSTRGERGFSITCDGIGKAKYNATRFESDEARRKHIDENCCSYPNSCPIAKAIEEGAKWIDQK